MLVTSILGVTRKRKSSCVAAIVFDQGLLFDSVSLPQNKSRQSLARFLLATFFWMTVLSSSKVLDIDPQAPAPAHDYRRSPLSIWESCRSIKQNALHQSSGRSVLPRIHNIRGLWILSTILRYVLKMKDARASRWRGMLFLRYVTQ